MVVDQFTPVYPFVPTPKFLQNNQLHNKLRMYMINLIIIYDVVNIFSVKNYESLRKLRVGMNRYTGVNWSTTCIGPFRNQRRVETAHCAVSTPQLIYTFITFICKLFYIYNSRHYYLSVLMRYAGED